MENTRYKFRAWQKYHKRMVEVINISFDDNGEINGVATFVENQAPQHINYRDDLLGGFFLKDERGMVLELMQYTGLKDKNGVEIFEGDLVRVGTQAKVNGEFPIGYVVRANDKPEMFIALPEQLKETGERQYYLENLYRHYLDEFEVIGNIHENPELLEGTVNGH